MELIFSQTCLRRWLGLNGPTLLKIFVLKTSFHSSTANFVSADAIIPKYWDIFHIHSPIQLARYIMFLILQSTFWRLAIVKITIAMSKGTTNKRILTAVNPIKNLMKPLMFQFCMQCWPGWFWGRVSCKGWIYRWHYGWIRPVCQCLNSSA